MHILEAEVQKIQLALGELGLFNGDLTGVWDKMTHDAFVAFQHKFGVVTGPESYAQPINLESLPKRLYDMVVHGVEVAVEGLHKIEEVATGANLVGDALKVATEVAEDTAEVAATAEAGNPLGAAEEAGADAVKIAAELESDISEGKKEPDEKGAEESEEDSKSKK